MVFFLLLPPGVSANCLDRSRALFDQVLDARQSCGRLELPDEQACMARFTAQAAERACLPSQRSALKTENFLWQQLQRIYGDAVANRITPDQFVDQSKTVLNLIGAERSEGARGMLREAKELSSAEADRLANRRIDRAIEILGGVVSRSEQSRSAITPEAFSYIINGKSIFCTKTGSVVVCN